MLCYGDGKRLVQRVLHRRFFAGYSDTHWILGYSLDTRILAGYSGRVVRRLSRGKYIILCENRAQRALNGTYVLLLVTGYLT